MTPQPYYPQLDGLAIPQALKDAIKKAYDTIYLVQAQIPPVAVFPRTVTWATVTQAIANGNALVPLAFDANSPNDYGAIHNIGTGADNTIFTILVPGIYDITCQLRWGGDTTGTYRGLALQSKKTTDTVWQWSTPNAQHIVTALSVLGPVNLFTTPFIAVRGDQFRMVAIHNATPATIPTAGALATTLNIQYPTWASVVYRGRSF